MPLTETFPDTGIAVVLPVKHVSGPQQGQWTYQEYLNIPEDGRRYEVMNGVLIMAPSPTEAHQAAVVRFVYYLHQHVALAGIGKVLVAPFDVVLTAKRVVQPDVLVILDKSLKRLTSANMEGGPDIVVEIASPGTAAYDRLSKYDAYEQAGVCEYWLADPTEKSIELLLLEQGRYRSLGSFKGKDTLPSRAVPAIAHVAVEQFFA
jgi:Uma2 family endonuclease